MLIYISADHTTVALPVFVRWFGYVTAPPARVNICFFRNFKSTITNAMAPAASKRTITTITATMTPVDIPGGSDLASALASTLF